ncbi:MAG: hypothetical protein IH830_12970 [Planctomycetes bacterium]|nr:hypothetical protein [Planctomycetota bacterium]
MSKGNGSTRTADPDRRRMVFLETFDRLLRAAAARRPVLWGGLDRATFAAPKIAIGRPPSA